MSLWIYILSWFMKTQHLYILVSILVNMCLIYLSNIHFANIAKGQVVDIPSVV